MPPEGDDQDGVGDHPPFGVGDHIGVGDQEGVPPPPEGERPGEEPPHFCCNPRRNSLMLNLPSPKSACSCPIHMGSTRITWAWQSLSHSSFSQICAPTMNSVSHCDMPPEGDQFGVGDQPPPEGDDQDGVGDHPPFGVGDHIGVGDQEGVGDPQF